MCVVSVTHQTELRPCGVGTVAKMGVRVRGDPDCARFAIWCTTGGALRQFAPSQRIRRSSGLTRVSSVIGIVRKKRIDAIDHEVAVLGSGGKLRHITETEKQVTDRIGSILDRTGGFTCSDSTEAFSFSIGILK